MVRGSREHSETLRRSSTGKVGSWTVREKSYQLHFQSPHTKRAVEQGRHQLLPYLKVTSSLSRKVEMQWLPEGLLVFWGRSRRNLQQKEFPQFNIKCQQKCQQKM